VEGLKINIKIRDINSDMNSNDLSFIQQHQDPRFVDLQTLVMSPLISR
jgi:hypothetical protein